MAIFYLDFSKDNFDICHCIPVSQFGCYGQVKKRMDDQMFRGVLGKVYPN